jgi:hypothetical protein
MATDQTARASARSRDPQGRYPADRRNGPHPLPPVAIDHVWIAAEARYRIRFRPLSDEEDERLDTIAGKMNDIIHGQDSSRASIVSPLLKGSLAAPRPLALGSLSAPQGLAKFHPPRLSAKLSFGSTRLQQVLATNRLQSSHTATYGYSNIGQAGDSGNHRQCDRVPTTSCCLR